MKWRAALLIGVAAGVIIIVSAADRIAQDPRYFDFADQRMLAGIPNALNVLSNLPFLAVGLIGLHVASRESLATTVETRLAWQVFFAGVALTAFGSGYFHLAPNNQTLIWDRLPMTIAFMSLASIVISEYLAPRAGAKLLWPLLAAGVLSVAWWAYSEQQGAGDLRPYAAVQFMPMLLIPLTILMYREASDMGRYLWLMVLFYVLAKVAEFLDTELYALGQLVSGHSLKHLFAALAPVSLLAGLSARTRHVR